MKFFSTLYRKITFKPSPLCIDCKWSATFENLFFRRCKHPKLNQECSKYLAGDASPPDWSFCSVERATYGECGLSGWYFEPKEDGIRIYGGLRL